MWLVVGLGNPGGKYAMTRHNVGFMVMDAWMNAIKAGNYRDEHKAETKKFKLEVDGKSEEILVVKPQTFMNLSGQSVQALMAFYKIPLTNLLVVHDDIDQPLGSMKFQKNRGHGGQNGVKNISELLGMDYTRLKIGVGRPENPGFDIADYVLSAFSKEEDKVLKPIVEKAIDGIECFIFKGLNQASTDFNGLIR
ncbi:MAG: aminoacyl-tRNA hydrolase [Bdellovibrio sp.]|nr:aminoacyl-tRNA hydrolase [Bdellovibrio sp.]